MIIRKKSLNKISIKRLIPYILLFLVVFQGLYSIYVSEVLDGSFGGKHARDELVRLENPYNPFNLLITGRAETFVAAAAISDNSIWGHGSWAPDKTGKYTAMIYKLQGQEDQAEGQIKNTDHQLIIPSHSVLMGTWMTSGVIGFIAFAYIFIKVLKSGFRLMKNKDVMNSRFSILIIFYFFNFIWTCLFSPLPTIKEDLPIILALFFVIEQKVFGTAGK
jgi:O-antigen ligase